MTDPNTPIVKHTTAAGEHLAALKATREQHQQAAAEHLDAYRQTIDRKASDE